MNKFIAAICLFTASAFGAGIPYLTEPTNSRVDTYIPSATGPNQKWVPYLNVTNAITNIVIRPGPGATVATNVNGVDYTIGTMWSTNIADGSITNINPGSGIVSVGGLTAAGHATLMSDNLATGGRLYNGKSNSVVVYAVDGSGDLVRIKNIPYIWPTSNAAVGQVLASTASGLLYWTNSTSSPFVAAGTNITLVTNGPIVTINGNPSDLWTNDLDGSIRILRPVDQTRMAEVFHIGTNTIAVEGLIQNTNAAAYSQAGYFENLGTNSGIGSLSGASGGSFGIIGESAGSLGALVTGDGIGVQGVADSGFKAQYGVQGNARAQFNAQTNVGGAFSANSNGKTGTTNVGLYVETQTAAGLNSNLVSSVAQLNSRDGSPLIVGQTNGGTSYLLRPDGTQLIGRGDVLGQFQWENGLEGPVIVQRFNASNGDPGAFVIDFGVSMGTNVYANGSDFYVRGTTNLIQIFASSDNSAGSGPFLNFFANNTSALRLLLGQTNANKFIFDAYGSFDSTLLGANSVIPFLSNEFLFALKNSNTNKFNIRGNGDMYWGADATVGLRPPATNSTAGQVLASDGGSPQQLYWTNQNSSGGGGGSGVGPGTLNHLSMFNSTTTNVVDSTMIMEATNQLVMKQASATWTNAVTNIFYERWTSTSSNRGYKVIESGNLFELKQFATETIPPGGDIFSGMIFNEAWRINGLGTVANGGHNGDLLPMADSNGSTGVTIGNVNNKVLSIYVSTGSGGGVQFPDNGYVQSAGVSAIWGGTAWLLHDKNSNNDLFGVFYNGGAPIETIIGGGFLSASTSLVSPASVDTFFGRNLNTAHLWATETNNGVASGIGGANGTGTDKAGGDFIIYGGQSTGTGDGGDLIGKTAQKAASTSSSANTLRERWHISSEPVTLTTNSATTVLTFTVPTSLTVVGGKLFATTEIKDATDIAVLAEELTFSAINKAGTVTATNQVTLANQTPPLFTGSAGVTTTWTTSISGTTVSIKCNAVTTGILSTTARVFARIELDSDGTSIVQFQ